MDGGSAEPRPEAAPLAHRPSAVDQAHAHQRLVAKPGAQLVEAHGLTALFPMPHDERIFERAGHEDRQGKDLRQVRHAGTLRQRWVPRLGGPWSWVRGMMARGGREHAAPGDAERAAQQA
jgi:hypothetical protein